MRFFKTFFSAIKKFGNALFALIKENNNIIYRVLHVEQEENGEYYVIVQVINKYHTFKMKPEEILENDTLTNAFSPTDIRSLAYLGYLGIHSPKYKILANRLSEQDSQFIFAIKEKGRKKAIFKTAEELSQDNELLQKFNTADIHRIGYTVGSQSTHREKTIKETLIKNRLSKDKDKNLE